MIYENVSVKVDGGSENATLTVMCHEKTDAIKIKKRPFILIVPGGGYEHVSKREGEPIAHCFMAAGYNVGVLTYSVAPYHYPAPYLEGFAALKYVIDNAEALGVLTDKMAVCGFSAGGHLAGLIGTGCNDPFILDYFQVEKDFFKLSGEILMYPVINGGEFAHRGSFDNLLPDKKGDEEALQAFSIDNRVTKDTPKTFLWSTFEDGAVPCENVLLMASALRKADVAFELHILPIGGHGLALGNHLTMDSNGGGANPYTSKWVPLCLDWLRVTLNWPEEM